MPHKNRPGGPLRIAIAHFVHEATTFAPAKAGVDGFAPQSYRGTALFGASEEISGFVKFASERTDVQLIPLESFGAVIGGSSVGWITRDAYEHYAGLILRDLRNALPVDAVYLSLHGAAAVEGLQRPEADLARRIREVLGPSIPLAGTFDPHGNQGEEFLRYANFSLAMKYFPHYDGRLQGERAARLLIRAAHGDYAQTTATRKPGIITPTVLQWTGSEPWSGIVQRALIWEARARDVYVSVFFGFPWSDSPDAGATIQVMTNNDQALADEIAEDMNVYFRRRRQELFNTPIMGTAEAVRLAKDATESRATPVVLADYSDRAGDATHILSEILQQDLENVIVATLRDEHVIETLRRSGAKAGDSFNHEVGGFAIELASGSPVRIQGKLTYFGPPSSPLSFAPSTDPIAVVEFGRGNALVITPYLAQIVDPTLLQFGPLESRCFAIWILKSRVHFRRGFSDSGFAKTIFLVDAPGPFLGTVHLEALPYKNVNLRSLYPYSECLDTCNVACDSTSDGSPDSKSR